MKKLVDRIRCEKQDRMMLIPSHSTSSVFVNQWTCYSMLLLGLGFALQACQLGT